MMVANAQNLIVTIKPANQRNTLNHRAAARQHYELETNRLNSTNPASDYNNRAGLSESRYSGASSGFSTTEKSRYLKGTSSTNDVHQQNLYDSEEDEEEDEIVDHTNATTYRIR